MRIGASLFLIALGAILKFAVTAHVHGVNVGMIGVILMVIGGVGLLFDLTMMAHSRRTPTVTRGAGVTYIDPADQVY